MATPDATGLNPDIDAWITAWADWVDRWLAGGVDHPGASAVLALERWLAVTRTTQWPALIERAQHLLDAQRNTDDKGADLLDLCAWLETTRRLRAAQRLAAGVV